MITTFCILGFIYLGVITYVFLAIWANTIDILNILDPDNKFE